MLKIKSEEEIRSALVQHNLWLRNNENIVKHAQQGAAALVAADIALGAVVNTQDESGMTALHHAAAIGSRSCVRVLVNCGKCDYLIKDTQGRYASELAIEWGRNFAIARLLSKKQAMQAYLQGEPAYERST